MAKSRGEPPCRMHRVTFMPALPGFAEAPMAGKRGAPCPIRKCPSDNDALPLPGHAADGASCGRQRALRDAGGRRHDAGGETWEDTSADLLAMAERPHLTNHLRTTVKAEGMLDGHAGEVGPASPDSVFWACRMGLFRGDGREAHREDMEIGRFSPPTCGRDVRVSPLDPSVMYGCFTPHPAAATARSTARMTAGGIGGGSTTGCRRRRR
jgi:hypothetical protein